ncbi:unnamed protein product [Paramecium sonneborni]|uniref:FCP1 homology domain-containing protein n=1 Tax=Paramecium sonneborni TaxID=65129 RepID=A0A8S1KUE3_9CILI|nr:unnamed protein product [Paramecium sonneborni]
MKHQSLKRNHQKCQNITKYLFLLVTQEDYADFILDQIDKENIIGYRLYCQYKNDTYSLNIDKIHRDLQKTIIIDDLSKKFKFQPDEIQITCQYPDLDEQLCFFFILYLIQIIGKKIQDLSLVSRKFNYQLQIITIKDINSDFQLCLIFD